MLVLLLKPVTFVVITLWSLLTRLIFNTIAYTIVLLIQGLRSSGEGSLGIFQQVAEIIKTCFEFILQILIDSISSIVSLVFDVLKDIITGSVSATGSMAAGLAEKLKTSFEESLKQLPELIGEISDMMSNMVTELWNNYKEAVEYVTGNA
jgi:phage-related protein